MFSMSRRKYLYSVAYLVCLFALTGCGAKLSIKANADQSTDIAFSMDVGKTVIDTMNKASQGIMMISDTADAFGTPSLPAQLFSAENIKKALVNTDLHDTKVATPSASSVELSGTLAAPKNQQYTAGAVKAANFLTCTANSLTVILSPDTVQQIAGQLPVEEQSYLDLLMAPVLTGEEMDKEDYLATIALIYGEDLASEMSGASVDIELESPSGKKIKKTALAGVDKSRVNGSKVSFSLPLVELLTMTGARTFSITW